MLVLQMHFSKTQVRVYAVFVGVVLSTSSTPPCYTHTATTPKLLWTWVVDSKSPYFYKSVVWALRFKGVEVTY